MFIKNLFLRLKSFIHDDYSEPQRNLTKIAFLLPLLFSLYLICYKSYYVYQYQTGGYDISQYQSLLIQVVVDLIVFILSFTFFLLSKRFGHILRFFFPLIMMVWLIFNFSQYWVLVLLPILLSGLIIRPKASLVITIGLFSESIVLFFFNGYLEVNFALQSILNNIMPVALVIFVYGYISYRIAKQLHANNYPR